MNAALLDAGPRRQRRHARPPLRFAPPLTVSDDEIDEAVAILAAGPRRVRHFLDVTTSSADELRAVLDLAEAPSLPPVLHGQGRGAASSRSRRTGRATRWRWRSCSSAATRLHRGRRDRPRRARAASTTSPGCWPATTPCWPPASSTTTCSSAWRRSSSVPVVNLLSDHSHPMQALADVLTMRQAIGPLGRPHGGLASATTTTWPARWPRPAPCSACTCASAAPPGYGPDEAELERLRHLGAATVLTFDRPEEAVVGADAVHTDVWTSMGQEAEADGPAAAFEGWTVTEALMATAGRHAAVLPLPARAPGRGGDGRGAWTGRGRAPSPRPTTACTPPAACWRSSGVGVTSRQPREPREPIERDDQVPAPAPDRPPPGRARGHQPAPARRAAGRRRASSPPRPPSAATSTTSARSRCACPAASSPTPSPSTSPTASPPTTTSAGCWASGWPRSRTPATSSSCARRPGCAHVVASALDRSGLPGLARHRGRRRHDAVRGVRARRRGPAGQDAARPGQPVDRPRRTIDDRRARADGAARRRAGRAGLLGRARHVGGGGVDAGEGRHPVHLHRRPRPDRRARPAPACPTGPWPTAPRRPAWSTAATSWCTRAWSRCSAAPSTSPPPARRTSTRRRSGGR